MPRVLYNSFNFLQSRHPLRIRNRTRCYPAGWGVLTSVRLARAFNVHGLLIDLARLRCGG